jgi:DNA mismatch endonuclease, patch repair protein
MADIWSKKKRSEVMSLIRSRGNKATELRLMEIFREFGITGWRRNQNLPGKPDFTFRRERVVVFVDGCFWHGCPRCYKRPNTNQEFWDRKIATNRKRDRHVSRELRHLGWHVVRVWQHQLENAAKVAGCVIRALNVPRAEAENAC